MRGVLCTLLSLSLAGAGLMGCDREVAHSEKTSTNPITGTQTTSEQTTYQRPNGSTYTNSSSNSSNANNQPSQ